jgi:hypothetical protein
MRSAVPYSYGLTPAQEVSAYGDVRWTATHAVTVVPVTHRWLRLTLWAPYPDLPAHPVAFQLEVNGRPVLTRDITSPGPVTFFVEMQSDPGAVLEMRVSRELTRDRALQIATTWHSDIRADVPSDHVVRLGTDSQ